jgi:hypothetical protein
MRRFAQHSFPAWFYNTGIISEHGMEFVIGLLAQFIAVT